MDRFFEVIQYVWNTHLFEIAGTPVTLATLLLVTGIIVGSLWLSKLIQFSLHRALTHNGMQSEGSIAVMQRLIHYSVMLVALGVTLDTVGIDLGALFAAGAIFAVGLGFAMQNIAQNFVSGVILLVERTIKPGDILEVDGMVVRVVEMGIRSTLARTRDDEELIIPNSLLVQNSVKNYTLRDSVYRLKAGVGVAYESDMRTVRGTLENAAASLSWRVRDKSPRVFMTEFGNSSVNFEVSVWIDNPWEARIYMSELNEAIWWSLQDAGVTIAFPQLDVHFDDRVTQWAERPSLERSRS